MEFTERKISIALMVVMVIGSLLFFVYSLITGSGPFLLALSGISTLLYGAMLYLYSRGWEWARYVLVLSSVIGMGSLQEPYVTQEFATALFLTPVLALILTTPAFVAISAGAVILILLARAGWQGVYADPISLLIYILVTVGMVLARVVADRALYQANNSAQRAEEARLVAEQQSQELATANSEVTTRLEEQQRLLDLVATLETPVIQLADGVLFAPLVGHLDSRRTEQLTTRLLEAAHEQRARLIVIDIAGVVMVDTAVARALLQMAQALRLLGCDVTLSGISSNVALTLTQLGIGLEGITTVRSPQEALARTLSDVRASARDERGRGGVLNFPNRIPDAERAHN
jgi:anti-anti-sigma regulatory factor